jgi:hypothetical protein
VGKDAPTQVLESATVLNEAGTFVKHCKISQIDIRPEILLSSSYLTTFQAKSLDFEGRH